MTDDQYLDRRTFIKAGGAAALAGLAGCTASDPDDNYTDVDMATLIKDADDYDEVRTEGYADFTGDAAWDFGFQDATYPTFELYDQPDATDGSQFIYAVDPDDKLGDIIPDDVEVADHPYDQAVQVEGSTATAAEEEPFLDGDSHDLIVIDDATLVE
ncbi:MAG: hypothetical protein SV186_04225 [Candidatus Nanohaloarchaea archaeon]|nr:hypothetical protein [Candidatus Nanohaloarchaea archaeon]